MAVFKRGEVYWYEFEFRGKRIRESTHQGNKNVARDMEAAHRTRLAKGEVGLEDKKPAPTLKDFAERFTKYIETERAEKPATITFYREKLRRLLSCDALASARLDAITEEIIDNYKQSRTRQVSRYGTAVSPASVNRELATLRRLLRLAHEWKVINRVPRIRLLTGEREREFVLSFAQEKLYLAMAPQPLVDVALLMLDTGMRVGEALGLERRDVRLIPAAGAKFGYIRIREGKSRFAKRNVSLTARVAEMLRVRLERKVTSEYVFAEENGSVMLGTSLAHQHERVRKLLKLSKEFVIHSFRHTMLTRLGESGADAFTIKRIAGHSSVTVSEKYVHPSPESVERAFERLERLATAERAKMEVVPEVPTISTTAGEIGNVGETPKSLN